MNWIKFTGCLILIFLGIGSSYAQNASKSSELRPILTEAKRFLDEGEFSSALEAYVDALEIDPENTTANFGAGYCYLKTTAKHKALQHLQKASQKNPTISTDIQLLLGQAYQFNQQFDEAIKSYTLFKQQYRGKDETLVPTATKKIEECENAIKYTKAPVNAQIDNFGKIVNSKYPDYAPIITADESVMFFTSRREGSTGGFVTMADGQFYEDIYVTFRIDDKWTAPRNMGPNINTKGHDACIAVSPDGKQLFIYKDAKNGDIYVATLMNPTTYEWSEPVSLGNFVNSKYQEPSISMTADGNTIYFSSDRPGGLGGLDIYVSHKDPQGKWTEVTNIGAPINTPYDDDAPFIHPDGSTLYFSSRGHATMGGYDIFKCYKENDHWSDPENIGYPINTVDDDSYFVLSADNKHGYYASAKEGGEGDKDIYLISMPKPKEIEVATATKLKPINREVNLNINVAQVAQVQTKNPTTIVRGTITDALSKEVLEANIVLTDNERNEVISELTSEAGTGKYVVEMPSGRNYGFAIEKDGYLFHSENYNIPSSTDYQELTLDVELKKTAVGSKIILKNIFFDFNQATLKKESTAELQNLIELLTQVPTMRVEISGHTDNKGSADYNKKLSERRAKSVVDYLIAKGIKTDRLTYKGYGSDRALVPNDSEINRQLNRRTEFEIIGN